MSASLVQAVARIKRNVAQCLTEASIEEACGDAGHTWRRRKGDILVFLKSLPPQQNSWVNFG